jgi:glutamate racemase
MASVMGSPSVTGSGLAAAQRPIAVFDSGVGGLTVLHELLVSLAHEDFVYLGDTARFPYGGRPPDELRRFAIEIADLLLEQDAKLLVIACNAATAAALAAVEEHVAASERAVGVVGVVAPESQQAVEATRNGRIGLLATPVTVASGAYARAVAAADPNVELVSVACPDLAPIIQAGFPFDEHVVDTVRSYVAPLRTAGVDTVILGCTHYPLVRPLLQRMLGRGVTLVASGAAIARRVEHALAVAGLESHNEGEGVYRFMCTADIASFRELGTRFLQMPLGEVAHVELPAAVTT